jgi:hypothetical protein
LIRAEIGEKAAVPKSSVSRQVAALIEDRLVKEARDKIVLTDAGREEHRKNIPFEAVSAAEAEPGSVNSLLN